MYRRIICLVAHWPWHRSGTPTSSDDGYKLNTLVECRRCGDRWVSCRWGF